MPVDTDLVHYLDANLAEVSGTSLFEGPPMETDTDSIFVTHYGGEPAEDRVMGASPNPPGIEVAHVQVMARSSVKATAQARAAAAFALLDGLHGQNIGPASRKYFEIESLDSEPFPLGQDDRGLWRYACSFRVRKARG